MNGILIYNRDMQCVAMIEHAESIIWKRQYYDIGTFEIYVLATKQTMSALKREYYVRNLAADDMAGIIKKIEYSVDDDGTAYITASGYDAVCLLKQRCLDGGSGENELEDIKLEVGLKKWVDRCILNPSNAKRKINELVWVSSGIQTRINASGGWANLWTAVQEVLKEYQVGIKIIPDWSKSEQQFGILLYEGRNRTSMQYCNVPVIFSEALQTVSAYETYTDSSEYANVAYTVGEEDSETKERKYAISGLVSNTSTGIERCELYVDASDLQKKDSWTATKYKNKLIQRGREKMQEAALVYEISGGADTSKYQYRTHYDVGDKVSLDTQFGVRAIMRVTEVQETWDSNGYSVEPTFGEVGIVVGGDEVMATNLTILADNLTFKSGTLEVAGIENYTCLLFYLNAGSGTDTPNRLPIPVIRNTLDSEDSTPDEVLRGGSTHVSSAGNIYLFGVNCEISGDTLTYVNSGCTEITSGGNVQKFEQRSILKIVGVY